MKNKKGFTLYEVIFITTILFLVIGFVLNLVQILRCDFEPPYKAEILRIGSIFVGILPACILGWVPQSVVGH